MTEQEILKIAIKAIDSKRGENIKVLKVGDLTILANYFVIANGNSNTQVKALADEVEFKLSEAGLEPHRTEGFQGANWIVLDYVDVVFHIFHKETRDFYDLERLWQDGTEISAEEFLK
ncbi:MAG: ribosome silencing factor [Ruminiclostridium sp.]|nr:ribosome silencing factor [Ruminiclostridium sp.]MDE6726077.1 ribosome silencing factor [Ruminiclostridium sp.]